MAGGWPAVRTSLTKEPRQHTICRLKKAAYPAPRIGNDTRTDVGAVERERQISAPDPRRSKEGTSVQMRILICRIHKSWPGRSALSPFCIWV